MKIYVVNDSSKRVDLIVERKKIEDLVPIAETNQDINVCQAIKIGEKFYTVCSKMCDNSYCIVEEITLSDEEDELSYEDEIICPVCKKAVMDSWEYPDYDSDFKCSYCGSIFSYERITNPEYNMTLKKRGEVLEINEVKK